MAVDLRRTVRGRAEPFRVWSITQVETRVFRAAVIRYLEVPPASKVPPAPGHSKSSDEIMARKVAVSSAAIRRRAFDSRLLEATVYSGRTISSRAEWKSRVN
ncbi:hypothetical protein K0M31_000575 [Melipona bicolor]|uniref:Uncharacterized protein n=1 Tax=Melipona bicolor TaxID=60889 RepID=A0AA40GDU5_9HYME|nr:hypothetical protein K0M31_000575 [Melipona bicolor]